MNSIQCLLTNILPLLEALKRISERKITGIYHVASREVTTPFSFASYLIHEFKGVKGVVETGWMSKYYENQGVALIPERGGLKTLETQERLGMKFMSWNEAIDELHRQNPDL